MTEKILFVDDEPHVLDSMRRQLRKRFQVITAPSGTEALEKIKHEGPIAVVVSDMRMPEMDGIELLSLIKELSPDTVRLMLTGNADQETAMEAVNKGQIFRFLTKPCPVSMLAPSLALALRQHRLITAEKELLDKTLKGSIKVLSDLLSFSKPAAFSAGVRIRSLVLEIAQKIDYKNSWQLEIAALMSQIGCITLPGEIMDTMDDGTD
ncbi:MAG: response regulator, partial [Desulfopila sp.]